jgi:hypothetical protein
MTRKVRTIRSVVSAIFFSTIVLAAGQVQETRTGPGAGIGRSAPSLEHAAAVSRAQSIAARAPEALTLTRSSEAQVSFEFASGEVRQVSTESGLSVRIAGADNLAEPGEPDLPSRVVLVGVPQEGDVRLTATTGRTEVFDGVTLRPSVGYGPAGRYSAAAGQGTGPVPEAAAQLLSIETIRDVRVARVRINPAQYDAGRHSLAVHGSVRVTLSFERPARVNRRPDALDSVVGRMLLNGTQALDWKLDPPEPDTSNFFSRSDVWCRIRTESTGVYRVSASELKQAGFHPESIVPASLKLYGIGPYPINGPYPDTMVEIPVLVSENGDGKFTGDEYLAFYAESPSWWKTGDTAWRGNQFTSFQSSWLTWGGENGRRMETEMPVEAVAPSKTGYAHTRLEPDSLCPARSGLLWLWKEFVKSQGDDSGGGSVPLDLPQRDTIYAVSGRFYGKTTKEGLVFHYARLYLNGVFLDSLRITAARSTPPATNFTIANVPAEAASRPGRPDTFTVVLYGDPEMVAYLDFVEVKYAVSLRPAKGAQLEFCARDSGAFEFDVAGSTLILNVTDPWNPKQVGAAKGQLPVAGFSRFRAVSGFRSATEVVRRTPGSLRNAAEAADYYIVCPDESYGPAKLLAAYREGNIPGIASARARAATASNIYDDYAFGLEEPGAIKKFLQSKRPAYVLLAGDGSYDYKNILGLRNGPPVLAYELGYDIDPEVYGNVAKGLDAWYADLDGGGAGPDLILGRVTCRSAAELRAFLDKVKAYEAQPLGYWSKRYILLADDEFLGSPDETDPIGFAHITGCEEQARIGYPLLDPVKVYLTEYPLTSINLKAEAQAELIRQLNSGALLWCFFGHGAGFQLCHEQALHITNTVPSVNNGTRSPFAFYGSCGVGRFEDTRYEAIAEELVRKDGGCIADVGATKATSPGGNELLARLMFRYLIEHPRETAGQAFFQAYTQSNILYHLFGDPATVLRMPVQGPVAQVTPDTFYPGAANRFETRDTVNHAGWYDAAVYEAVWHRQYRSDVGGISYDLPGYQIHRSTGSFDGDVIRGNLVVPRINYPETTLVPNGSYTRTRMSGRLSLLSYDGLTGVSGYCDSIALEPRLEESFRDTLFPPLGWQVVDADGDTITWHRSTTSPHTSPACAASQRASQGENDEWLISPRLRVGPADVVTYWWRANGAEGDSLAVLVSYGDSSPGSFRLLRAGVSASALYRQDTVWLGAEADTVAWIAFRYRMHAGQAGTGLSLDDIRLAAVDNQPPDVALSADGVPISPGDTALVPRNFVLSGVVSDPSGILLVPLPDVGLSLTLSGVRTSLASYFRYELNSATTGTFEYPVKLPGESDSITVVASDNMVDPNSPGANRRMLTIMVRTYADDALRIADGLVFPNPARGPARLTFTLSRAALVSVKVYTIAGRLVRYLPPRPCGFDYNQIEWDGLDKDGQPLANGIYLYKLDAQATETSTGTTQAASASLRDKFIVYR